MSGARAGNSAPSAPRTNGPVLYVPTAFLDATFAQVRACGRGQAECQVLWVGPWSHPDVVSEVVHPEHRAHRGGFVLDDAWLTRFWLRLVEKGEGIRAQVHTHPREAFHSATDDAWPVVHLEGFLSLVIPDFGHGPISLERTYLAEIGPDGEFRAVDPLARLSIT
jgi:hypothetical protein